MAVNGMADAFARTRKGWVSAILAGVLAAAFAASQMDFSAITANNVRDLVIAFVISALMTGGVTYMVPNKL